ncbi:P-loop containing nucleoside triphosphate hydrolase protein [Lipomyces arxii]|uniref:P-loop containing nucleoside triphosphate hydrolase protein n=1 Tax=Lipomyces arxii TaxID=56418 RepID=UPI0034CF74A9
MAGGKSLNINNVSKPAKSAAKSGGSSQGTNNFQKEEPSTGYIVRPTVPTPGLQIFAHPFVLKTHHLSSGDFVRIWKSSSSFAAAGSGVSAVGQIFTDEIVGGEGNVLQISLGLRCLVGVLLGDRVRLERYNGAIAEASEIWISSMNSTEIDEKELRKLLGKIKYIAKKQVVSSSIGKFRIHDITSNLRSAVCMVTSPSVSLHILDDDSSSLSLSSSKVMTENASSYAQLGGLDSEIALIRKTIELPLLRPEIFTRFNVSPLQGILLHGPSGTGKTSLLQAIAYETAAAHILSISASSILGRYLGDTEAALTKVFDEAKMFSPSVILIDEIDALAPRRDGDAAGETETRIVATLLTLFDSLAYPAYDSSNSDVTYSRVVVVAATNRIASVDPALRRPGRFDREIELRIPDASSRADILSIQLQKTPCALAAEDIARVASKTHGFVGADLSALVREAVMQAVSRADAESKEVTEMEVIESDFTAAMLSVRASAMREIFLETPKVYWTDIGGQEDVKQKLKEAVEWPLTHPKAFTRLGVTPPRGILLYGPPGCSKTLTAKALATEAGLNFLAVKGPEIFNKYVGESERAVREIFRKARNASPSIIFFDEIDALSAARGQAETGGDRVLTSMLTEMDGVESMGNVMVLAATNRPEIIDSALLRPGRIDRMLYVGPPDLDARKKILEVKFKSMSIGDDVDVDSLALKTDGASGAEIVALCQEAGLQAMNESLDSLFIHDRHFSKALAGLNKSITPDMIKFYEDFKAGIAKV